jgi:hypothetical protein
MRMRIVQAITLCGLLTSAASAQSPLDRGPRRGFDIAIVPAFSLGFNAIRAWQSDSIICDTQPSRCISQGMGNAPMLGADVQVPLGRMFGLSVGGAVGQPQRVQCKQGTNCQATSTEKLTVLKGSALLLFRLKPQAPVFIGVGYGASRASRGAIQGQDTTVSEQGPVVQLAFDFALGQQVGLRISWWNYWMGTSTIGIGGSNDLVRLCSESAVDGCFQPEKTAHDQLLSFGARVRLPK